MYNKKVLSKATAELDKAKAPKKPKDIITDPMGQWKYPGQVTRIPSNDITMEGVNYPVVGVANTGQRQIMLPGADYTFPGADYVDEYPQMQSGGTNIPTIEDAGSYNEENIWVPDWSLIKEQAKKLGAKTVRTQSGVIIQFDSNWNPKNADDNAEMRKGGSKKTKSISGTNKLLDVHPFFKSYKHKRFDPKAKHFQEGGAKTLATNKSKDGTITNKVRRDGKTFLQVKTKDGKYYEKEVPTVTKAKGIEAVISKSIGNPMDRAYDYVEKLRSNGEDPQDNLRHATAGRYTAEGLLKNAREGYIPFPDAVNKATSWLGANALGIGHELTTIFQDERPWGVKLREAAEDIYNNGVGVNQGLSDKSTKAKTQNLKNRSLNYELPDGYGEEHPYHNKWVDPYSKKQDGGYIEAELTDDEIEEYRKGGFIVEDISVPELNQAQKGGAKPYRAKNQKDYEFRKKAYNDSLAVYKLDKEYDKLSLATAKMANDPNSSETAYFNLQREMAKINDSQNKIIKNSNVPNKLVPSKSRMRGDRAMRYVLPKQPILAPLKSETTSTKIKPTVYEKVSKTKIADTNSILKPIEKTEVIKTQINKPVISNKSSATKQHMAPKGYAHYTHNGQKLDPAIYGYAPSTTGDNVQVAQFIDTYGLKKKMAEYNKNKSHPWIQQKGGMVTQLTSKEIQDYINQGYIVEEH